MRFRPETFLFLKYVFQTILTFSYAGACLHGEDPQDEGITAGGIFLIV